jgi:hypothetical protein
MRLRMFQFVWARNRKTFTEMLLACPMATIMPGTEFVACLPRYFSNKLILQHHMGFDRLMAHCTKSRWPVS